jgi:hypothetical protein
MIKGAKTKLKLLREGDGRAMLEIITNLQVLKVEYEDLRW